MLGFVRLKERGNTYGNSRGRLLGFVGQEAREDVGLY
jgi:hypothetical protein